MADQTDAMPTPDGIVTVEEFMVRLRQLRRWAGLTYRDLEARGRDNGDHLARSTLASTLGRAGLPRQDFVEAVVRACGLDPSPWVRVCRRLALLDLAAEQPVEPSAERGSAPRQLPPAPPVLAGRDRESEQVVGMLTAMPVAVISGPPGVGKSAVGLRAAHQVADLFPDGQVYVNLRGTVSGTAPLAPAEVAGVLLRSLGAADAHVPADAEEAAGRLRSELAGRRVLLVLDDVTSAAQVRALVPCGGRATALLTSRAALTSLDGSRHVRLGPLSRRHAQEVLEHLLGSERVRAEPEAARLLADLCGRLPLGLRIAAARLAARPGWRLRALTERMSDERRRLDELRVDDMNIRQSLAASFEDLARGHGTGTRLASRVLAAATEEVRPEAAAALLNVSSETVEDVLERLVDVNLVESRAPGCYHVPELVRIFASEWGERHVRFP
ncbi:NB-ARC domain-containing protein [Spirillospora sp. NPDC050679]